MRLGPQVRLGRHRRDVALRPGELTQMAGLGMCRDRPSVGQSHTKRPTVCRFLT